MNKTFSIISVRKRKINGWWRLVVTASNGERYWSGGNNPAIEMLENNSINLGGKRWRLFSSLDDQIRLEMLDFFRHANGRSAVDEEIENAPICRCPCHFHPGAYQCDPCHVCGHNDSKGQLIGGKVYGFWIGHRYQLTEPELNALLNRQ